MKEEKPVKTLVEAIKQTGWWPRDVLSFDPVTMTVRREVVVLDSIAPGAPFPIVQSAWKVHEEEHYQSDLPIPFSRYKMNLLGTPTHFHVLVADVSDPRSINPLTDCCTLVPFDTLNSILTPEGRIEYAKNAMIVRLNSMGAWPFGKPLSVVEVVRETPAAGPGSWVVALEPGKDVTFNPKEWLAEDRLDLRSFGDPAIHALFMIHKPRKLGMALYISEAGEKSPNTIDPYSDCCTEFKKPGMLNRVWRRLTGYPLPNDENMKALCRAAIASHLNNIGAWPPRATEKGGSSR